MTKKDTYQKELRELIKKYGYWSEEVKELNNKAISEIGYNAYTKIQDRVLLLLKY